MSDTSTTTIASHNDQIDWEWVRVPAGDFLRGSQHGADPHAESDEAPERTVHLDEYAIAKTPVTNAQYAVFVRSARYPPPQHWGSRNCPPDLAQHPVVFVSWHDACAFCDWASVRLPTEQEWEKAARGVDGRLWPWGNQSPDEQHCNFGNRVGATTPVDKYSPAGASPFGVLDAAGNVWEWVEDVYGDYDEAPAAMPDSQRVLRGGSFHSEISAVRCANRSADDPTTSADNIGFRVVRVRDATHVAAVVGEPSEASTAAPAGNTLTQRLYRLFIGPRMSLEDMQDLCFRLGIDWENLSGDTKRSKARALITQYVRLDQLNRVRDTLREMRPDLSVDL